MFVSLTLTINHCSGLDVSENVQVLTGKRQQNSSVDVHGITEPYRLISCKVKTVII